MAWCLRMVKRLEKAHFLTIFLVALILLSTMSFLVLNSFNGGVKETTESKNPNEFYVGVTFCGNTTAEAQLLVDRVKTYTNVFVLQSGPVSKNETATNEICDYAVASGMRIIVFFGWFDPDFPWQVPWLDFAKQRYGDKFLGVYYYDEPGGAQIDYNWSLSFARSKMLNTYRYQVHAPAIDAYLNGSAEFRNYDTAASIYTNAFKNDTDFQMLKNRSITSFTSEYALYWYTYLAGYNVLLTQFGWNDTLTQNIALTRGAARMQNKTWGAIITWKYDQWPYLDTGEEIYKQMVMAYDAGAKYVTIFNYANDTKGTIPIMRDEHFEALEKFWNYIMDKPGNLPHSDEADVALVLPLNYGWGMRRSDDRIWYWGPDEKSSQIWNVSRVLLARYGTDLDIVYDDPAFPVIGKYNKIYYWNATLVNMD